MRLKVLTLRYFNWAATWQNQQNDCTPSEDCAPSLIRVFSVCMKKAWGLSYPLSAQRWLWSDWADAQADLSLRWAHSHFVGFVMSQFNYLLSLSASQKLFFVMCPWERQNSGDWGCKSIFVFLVLLPYKSAVPNSGKSPRETAWLSASRFLPS